MKLSQGQVWKCDAVFIRIVTLKRLEVGYKSFLDLKHRKGKHTITSKKDFCRMLKGARLLTDQIPNKRSKIP